MSEKQNANEISFGDRLMRLRTSKNVSARDMSLSLGASESYINRIETGKMMPSMSGFFAICEYFGLTPAEFFAYGNDKDTQEARDAAWAQKFRALPEKDREHLLTIIDELSEIRG